MNTSIVFPKWAKYYVISKPELKNGILVSDMWISQGPPKISDVYGYGWNHDGCGWFRIIQRDLPVDPTLDYVWSEVNEIFHSTGGKENSLYTIKI